jgi:acetolactate synthase-1/2/3 large subunit
MVSKHNMKTSDYIAKYLENQGVTHVFELVGGMITFLLDSLQQQTSIKIVSMHHEQGAAFAAEGYARMTGRPGVAMATSGPGATNLLTAIGSCYFDSVPTVFITGQVNRHEQKGNLAVRQLGFQETDIVSMVSPITKGAWLVNSPDEMPHILENAFILANSGRPGPVLIDVPMDVQRAEISDLSRLTARVSNSNHEIPKDIHSYWNALYSDLKEAKRPLILAGGGVQSARAINEFRTLVQQLQIPVVNSLMAVDAMSADDSLRVGLLGSYGNRWTNIAISESDFLLVLGSRLDVRQTGADTKDFKGARTIYHVDCEAGEMNNRVTGCCSFECELKPFLQYVVNQMPQPCIRRDWINHLNQLKAHWPDTNELPDLDGINPNHFMHRLSAYSGEASAYIADVGQHQMWAAQSIDLGPNQRFLTSGGMGAMGFALPTGIGACFATGKPVVVIAGDGGFQLNIQELQTIVRNQLPVKMIVINNHCHGMVRQFQDSYFHGRVQSTVWGYSAPSFSEVARAYGIPSLVVESPAEVEESLASLWSNSIGPFLLEVLIPQDANAYPKMAFGKPICEMEPFSKPIDMEGT